MKAVSTIKMILASSSPRRREILADMGYMFRVVAPDLDETQINGESPVDHVLRLSEAKAERVARRFPDDLVIGADTIVVLEGRILGKPESPAEAADMLRELSDKTHTVYTGLSLTISADNLIRTDYDATRVTFNKLRDEDIGRYIASGEPLDKAGSYGIQGMGSFLVAGYEGEFDTVIGFPSKLFKKMYNEVIGCRNR